MRLTKQEKENLKYHAWCKRVCSEAGWHVFGTTIFVGASVFTTKENRRVFEIPHEALSMLAKRLGIPDYE